MTSGASFELLPPGPPNPLSALPAVFTHHAKSTRTANEMIPGEYVVNTLRHGQASRFASQSRDTCRTSVSLAVIPVNGRLVLVSVVFAGERAHDSPHGVMTNKRRRSIVRWITWERRAIARRASPCGYVERVAAVDGDIVEADAAIERLRGGIVGVNLQANRGPAFGEEA